MSPRSNQKSALGQRSTTKKHVTSMSCTLEPAIWTHDTGQQIPCFERYLLIITLTLKFAAYDCAYASFPWKLDRYSYGVQFEINCTALDQSKLSNFVECTIKKTRTHSIENLQCMVRAETVLLLQRANKIL